MRRSPLVTSVSRACAKLKAVPAIDALCPGLRPVADVWVEGESGESHFVRGTRTFKAVFVSSLGRMSNPCHVIDALKTIP